MKFALGEIRVMKDPIVALLDKELPVRTAWKINKLVKAFDRELIDIEESRVNLVKKYGESVDGEEGDMQVPQDKMEQFVQEFNDFLNEEVEIEFEPISIDSLGDFQIAAKDLMFLEKIFE